MSLLVHTPQLESKIELTYLSTAKVEKYLRKEYQEYLVIFSVHIDTEEGIEKIPIVRDFLEVFPT